MSAVSPPASIRRRCAVRSPRCTGILTRREEYFRANSIDSIATYRRRALAGEITDQPWGDVFLVIDGWGNFRNDYDGLDGVVTDIAARGLGYGMHVVITAPR